MHANGKSLYFIKETATLWCTRKSVQQEAESGALVDLQSAPFKEEEQDREVVCMTTRLLK